LTARYIVDNMKKLMVAMPDKAIEIFNKVVVELDE
jgi:hypothetical protein